MQEIPELHIDTDMINNAEYSCGQYAHVNWEVACMPVFGALIRLFRCVDGKFWTWTPLSIGTWYEERGRHEIHYGLDIIECRRASLPGAPGVFCTSGLSELPGSDLGGPGILQGHQIYIPFGDLNSSREQS